MMREIETFESERKAEHKFLIHIATNKDEKFNQILRDNFGNPKARKKYVRYTHCPKLCNKKKKRKKKGNIPTPWF
jgi:hypothetical protein